MTPGDWDWAALNSVLRPKLIGLAVRKYNFSREEAEDAVQTVYMREWAAIKLYSHVIQVGEFL